MADRKIGGRRIGVRCHGVEWKRRPEACGGRNQGVAGPIVWPESDWAVGARSRASESHRRPGIGLGWVPGFGESLERVVTGTGSIVGLLGAVATRAGESGVFGRVGAVREGASGGILECEARDSGAPASYRVEIEGDRVFVSLVMADRWLSHSIEADLLNTGDKMEDLLDEELAELGVKHKGNEVSGLQVEHYRSEEKLFTFRSRVPGTVGDLTAETVVGCLLAYEACFGNLGDMRAGAGE